MELETAIFFLRRIKEAFEEDHLNTEAEALSVAIGAIEEQIQHKRSWAKLVAEERS